MPYTTSPFQFGEFLHRSGRLIRLQLLERLEQEGYSYPIEFWPCLKFLHQHPQTNQQALTDFILRDKATAARMLKKMVDAQLVLKLQDQTNRRQNSLVLTPAGEALYQSLARHVETIYARALHGISPEQLSACSQMLQQVLTNLKATT